MNWFLTSTLWYIYLLIIGLLFFPLASKLFSSFVDRGYPFAKTIGIIVGSYVVYLLGIFHMVPFSKETIFFVLILLGLLIYKVFKDQIVAIKTMTRKQLLLLIGEELFFFVGLIFLIVIRGQEPSIHGLEKFMDYGFMQSILKSSYFPPLDMWLSADPTHPTGYPINYYFFGHLSGAFLMKLSGIAPTIGYNFILATIFAQGMTLAFSISANIVYLYERYILKKIHTLKVIFFGLFGAVLVNLAGNLHTIYLLTKGYENEHPLPFWTIFQSPQLIATTMKTNHVGFIEAMLTNARYWYPNATRFIPFTIHEFPSYSYVVADLHGHVFDIPFVLLTLALILAFFIQIKHISESPIIDLKGLWTRLFRKKSIPLLDAITTRFHITQYELFMAVLFGFMLAIHYMTNAFDGPIYLLFLMMLYFFLYRISIRFFFLTGVTALSYILFALPFSWFFTPFVSAIGVNCSPAFLVAANKIGPFLFEKGNCQISEPYMLFILWGFFWISATLLGIYLYLKKQRKTISILDQLVMLMFGFGTFLIIIPEFFYIKDIYPAHFRANTMFKMGYQAFIMMSLASSYVLYRLTIGNNKKKYYFIAIYTFFVSFVLVYSFMAFPSYYPGLFEKATYERAPVIDGATWLTNEHPDEKEIIEYINANIQGQPVILEAQGDSYTDYNLVSAYTGSPTIAGWWVHEWLWRGSSDIVGERIPDISAIYESTDAEYTKYLLDKYNVSYVLVSKMEKDKYPNLQEAKFAKIGTKVFQTSSGFGALYRIN